ncbi:hypothetical protein OTERR_13010 [Oryzomicrobium terrae]|uniref:Ryanodine receptor Ryr domain-containing protein n=1 Tax=Oryzomicrobium terrae TaxID=1735038 RepID=A0A5C1E9E6_9RHOO|nr:RyR domain-containing protein [Oryzomicrobium terrae]QEL64777.1 hypothetical protein OTERR_13010 [Oryzomicrobium terrae]
MKRALIAAIAHTINAAYCASLGDASQPTWDDAPEWQKNSALAGVDMHIANPDATPEQSHESWLAQKLADGWQYGPEKDPEKKLHPCCVPYADLPVEQKTKDYLFRATVHALKDIPDADEAVAQALTKLPMVTGTVKAQGEPDGLDAVRYIGKRDEWFDRVYNSGLVFFPRQVRRIPPELARKLLKHSDLFEPAGDGEDSGDTAQVLAQAKGEQTQKSRELEEIQALYDQVDRMDKAALVEFAKVNYRQDLDKRKSAGALQTQVKQMIDQFGVV